jgi:TonB family protein
MKKDFLFSIILHVLLIVATLISAPFSVQSRLKYDDIIRVQLTAPADMFSPEPVALEPVPVPKPAIEEEPDIPISDPTTMKEAVITPESKPKPEKPKEEKKKKQNVLKKNKSGGSDENKSKEIDTPGGGGSPFAGATIDNANFDYPYWFTQAFNKISSNFRNTVYYDGTLICVVYFQVIRSGRVVELHVEKPSGIPEFDQCCLNAIESSTPFPPLPREFRDEIIGITLPIKVGPR